MATENLVFDVTEEVGTGEPLKQTAWLFRPSEPAAAKAVLLCLPGGTYDKQYWHLEVAGHPGYSFAEHLASQGYLVVTLDHLGVGGSSDPAGDVGLPLLAKGDGAVATQLISSLRAGNLAEGLPPLDLPLIGVGHSMGACLTTMVQAQLSIYDAVVLLGYGVQVANVHDEEIGEAELDARIQHSEEAFRRIVGIDDDTLFAFPPRDYLHGIFHAPSVPAEVIATDDAAQSRVPVRASSEVTTPGYVQQYTKKVDVPVFLAYGATVDVSPDPYAEPANYSGSGNVTLYLVPDSGHIHNFATSRTVLWDRIADWIPTVSAHAPVAAVQL